MVKKYLVELSPAERKRLCGLVSKGKGAARVRQHAQILLKADETPGSPAWPDQQIAEAFGVNVRTVERIRLRLVEHGLEDALMRRQNPSGAQSRRILDGASEARMCQIACSAPPQGRDRWSIRLLAETLVRLEVVDAIGRETVRVALKKMRSSHG